MLSENNNLYFDIGSGSFIYIDKSINQQLYTKTYTQTAESTEWIISHNRNTTGVIAHAYDVDNNRIFPDILKILDLNTIQFTFSSPIAGKVNAVFFST